MYQCCCGRGFLQPNAFSKHQKSCKKSKTRLSSALDSAKENWNRLKKARLEARETLNPASPTSHSTSTSTDTGPPVDATQLETQPIQGHEEPQTRAVETIVPAIATSTENVLTELNSPLMEEVWLKLLRGHDFSFMS